MSVEIRCDVCETNKARMYHIRCIDCFNKIIAKVKQLESENEGNLMIIKQLRAEREELENNVNTLLAEKHGQ